MRLARGWDGELQSLEKTLAAESDGHTLLFQLMLRQALHEPVPVVFVRQN